MASLTFTEFQERFDQKVEAYKISWELIGFYAPDGRIYPFGTDTKVISTVFESLAAPLINDIATQYDYSVEGAGQTIYPDFTLTPKDAASNRIAIDIKTTYRRFNAAGRPSPFRYTLGSYTSFLRQPGATKNIKYPYREYSDHWVIGFLYTRRPGMSSKVYYEPGEVKKILCPYQDVEYFVQEKYKIVGLNPASGNTANIGSFPTANIRELREGLGPFRDQGKESCDEYWRNYGRSAATRLYSDLDTFLSWLKERESNKE